MPRKTNNIITIQDSPSVKTNDPYESLVKSIKIDKKKNALKIECMNLEACQYGRLHTIILPLPACPGNPACLFLEACGIDSCEVDKQINLDTLIGNKIFITFLDTKTAPFDHKSVMFSKA
mgnify:CR=1 FL=1